MMYVVKESYVTALLALMALGRYTPTPWTEIFTHTHTHTKPVLIYCCGWHSDSAPGNVQREHTHTPKLCSL